MFWIRRTKNLYFILYESLFFMFFYFFASKKINPILLPWALFIGKYAVFLLSEIKMKIWHNL
ncbi:hypothetical protein DW146_11705 [Phocaeicola vulgatus]|uniref:Uncharacterized protein n=1 Tax=Phocaeicola vulgatus TaxID=821 RepID=A0A3E4WQ35_PHOVU|nr:hypothetical protein DXC16_09275 [Phocaeicola vulgatus]RHC25142.1 hypothetical protein DW857_02835 [Phocaeicola vulgatus]RHJ00854.1 hypothetical protein DW146_11705 [Phocaeicola vulgatus]RHK84638.1 hypothetical protein DW047_04105 [Phocaeicola vulgatus]RHL61446.1 hypothetical protein DW013_03415 [Phocaeicola vulgatus]